MLELKELYKTFNPGTINAKTALNGLSLTLNDGDFVTVIGGNGAGKSTMLNATAGTFFVDSGKVIIDGSDVTNLPEHKRAAFIGRVFQDPMMGTAPSMWIEENLALAARRGQRRGLSWGVTKEEKEQYRELLGGLGLGLESRLTTKVSTLSGGQRQALTLLMATLKRPKLLLLDEHTAALDPKTAAKVMELTDRIVREGQLTTLMITHNMRDAIQYGNRLIMLHDGHVILDIAGEEKKKLTVPDLLEQFTKASGDEFANDRAILSRYDDSVVRVVNGAIMPVRRARGYAPQPLPLPALDGAPSCVLACGPQQKATIALTREGTNGEATCFVSQHIGDVENGGTFDAWNAARTRLEDLFDLAPAALACDLHPSYLSDQWAREQARKCNLPLVEVQHHHAHIASVMAEAIAAGQLTTDTRVLGIAFDGTGAGTDGTIWGGEFLVASLDGFERTAHLLTWALPGGAASVRDARRSAFALLSELGLLEHPGAAQLLDSLDEQTRSVTATMIERGINSPRTSSMGRLFDAAAAILGICDKATYEGEPAIELEAAAWRAFSSESACPTGNMVSFSVTESSRPDDCHVLNSRPLFEALLEGIRTGVPAGKLALDFHVTIARSSARIAREICAREGLDTVALSGGVFMNRLLLQLLTRELKSMGLTVLIPRSVPVNDGCIAYGQAVIARARLAQTASR